MPSKGAVKATVKVIDTILSALRLCIWVRHIIHKHMSRRRACMHRLALLHRTHARTHSYCDAKCLSSCAYLPASCVVCVSDICSDACGAINQHGF